MKSRLFLFSFLLLASCSREETPSIPSYPIKKTTILIKDQESFIETIGHITASATVDVRSRVEGELTEILFKEGEFVTKEKPLFIIDKRPFEISLASAEATLQENKANLSLANDVVRRYVPLLKDEYVSQLNFKEYTTNAEKFTAIVKQNEEAVKNAALNLEFCTIKSPIEGVTGLLQINKGNLIAANDPKPLITINQIRPIYVLFSVPENRLLNILQAKNSSILKTYISFDNFTKTKIEGDFDLINNNVTTDTGMIQVRAVYKNSDLLLWPGQYVKVRLVLSITKNALLIPSDAIIYTMQGPAIFVLKADNTAEMRYIKLGQEEEYYIQVLEGIKPDEEIITEGQQNLYTGAHVYESKETVIP